MLLYRTQSGPMVEHEGQRFRVDEAWETLINRDDCLAVLQAAVSAGQLAITIEGIGTLTNAMA